MVQSTRKKDTPPKKKKGSEGKRKEGRGEGKVTEEENLKSCVWLAGGLTSVSDEQLQSVSG